VALFAMSAAEPPDPLPPGPLVRVLLAGAGRWGTNIARSLRDVPGAELRALCDPDLGRSETLRALAASGSEAPAVFAELGQALEHADAVIVAAPDALHVPLALAALRAGKHVLVEKPLALAVADAERLLAAARAERRVLMVGHILNYHPTIERLEAELRSGRLGRPLLVQTERFIERPEPGVDAWWSLAPHDLSLSLRLLGEGRLLWAARSGSAEARACLVHESGAEARLHMAHGPGRARRRRLLLAGSDATLVFDDGLSGSELTLWSALAPCALPARSPGSDARSFAPSERLLDGAERLAELPVESGPRPLVRELRHFVEAIVQGSTPRTDAHEGLAVVRLLEAGTSAAARAERYVASPPRALST
jgi:predicted dehydrogenase